ncbi:MAG: hypothetical protein GY755_24850 [Chloroflexi bacterium]|nr:hypothetical protein [Chloroflexota bacterium]
MTKHKKVFRTILLILAILSSPFACLGAGSIIFAFTDTDLDFFNATVHIENQTNESLYITPITTTYADPRVILQPRYFRNKELLLRPHSTIRVSYDSADTPMEGIALCSENGTCRLLENSWEETLIISDFDALPLVDESWLSVIDATSTYNFSMLIYIIFFTFPFIFLGLWWRLRQAKV